MVSGLNGSGLVYCTKPCWLKAQLVCYVCWKDQTLGVGCKEYMVSGLVRAYVSVVSGEWYYGGGLVSGEWCYSLPGHRIIPGRWAAKRGVTKPLSFHPPNNLLWHQFTAIPSCWSLFCQNYVRGNAWGANGISPHLKWMWVLDWTPGTHTKGLGWLYFSQ